MPLDFKHRYILDEQITDKGIYYVQAKITYKNTHFFNKFVFCKKVMRRFEYNLNKYVKSLHIKQNQKDVILIEISVISYHGNTMVK